MEQNVQHATDSAVDGLVAKVAAERVRDAMRESPGRKSLFCIVDLGPRLTSHIARTLRDEIAEAEVYVHPDLDDGTLPDEMLSVQSATHYRNMERTGGSGAIVFSVPTGHLDVVGATVREIKQISEDALSHAPEAWVSACPELSTLTDPAHSRYLETVSNFVRGAFQAGLVSGGLPMLARFMIRLDAEYAKGAIERALDNALPAFRIPAGIGRFKDVPSRGRLKSVEKWAEELADLARKAEDALYLRNDRGAPLDRPALSARLAELEEDGRVTRADAAVMRALLDDQGLQAGKWSPAQEAACGLRWEVFESVLKITKAPRKEKLAAATRTFFATYHPTGLSEQDRHLLDTDISESGDPDEDERDFFFRHRDTIKEDRKLLKRWEGFIFRKTEEHANLLSGLLLAASEMMASVDTMPETPRLAIRLDGGERTNFWKNKNSDVCRYLRDRYRGLPELLAPVAECDFGNLWTHSGIWDQGGKPSEKTSLSSRQFKFDICLVDASALSGGLSKEVFKAAQHSTQLVWTMPPNSFANAYSANMEEISGADGSDVVLSVGSFSRSQRTDRVVDGIIDLQDRGSVIDVLDSPLGNLVDINDRRLDMGRAFTEALEDLSGDVLASEDAVVIKAAFDAFRATYAEAVRAFIRPAGTGLASDVHYEQSRMFGDLLDLLRRLARNDDCRKRLWLPALSFGMAHSLDRPNVAISCPWHPFRLAEAKAKADQVVAALQRTMESAGNGTDVRTYARRVAEMVDRPWHPTMTLSPGLADPKLLVETEGFAEFALLEPPTIDEGAEDAFDGFSKEATSALLTQAREYLDLNPHERANFSIVLYNADNRDLPSRLAQELARKIENESDLRCDLILTHTNQHRLRQIYAEQNVTISRELDGVLASEAAQTFLSRLRVDFVDVGSVGHGAIARKADIVLLHDVIARGAKAGWRRISEPYGGWPEFGLHWPDAETRRLSHGKGERKSETLMVPPSRPLEVQRYIDLVHDLHTADRDAPSGHFVPVREVNFDDPRVADTLDRAHGVAEWVVTFDAIANEQLLKNNGIKIIRNVAWPGSSHNVIVSTRKISLPLRDRIARQVMEIMPKTAEAAHAFADACIDEAATISGRVVLRAARQERNAYELLGLVLSKHVLMASLPERVVPVAWLQIDDFGEPLGLKSRKRADILVLCAGEEAGRKFLDMYVIESKFVGSAGEAEESRSSLEQTEATTEDLKGRVLLDSDLLNRGLWRSRLADLILEHGTFPGAVGDADARAWASMVRSDDACIRIRGLSMVFVHDCMDGKPPAQMARPSELRQYIFDRPEIARIFRGHEDPASTPPLRVVLPPPAWCGFPSAEDAVATPAGEDRGVTSPGPGPTGDGNGAALPEVPDGNVPTQADAEEELPVSDGAGAYPESVRRYVAAFPRPTEEVDTRAWLDDAKTRLRQALRNYGHDCEIIGDRLTPNAALVRFRGNDRLTVADVERKRDVLQTSHGIIVTDVRPGVGEVIVMVQRPKRSILPLPDLMKRRVLQPTAPVLNGSFLIGERETDGELLYLNIFGENGGQPQHGPHTLIAGESGGGKGVLTRNILLDLFATNSPRNVRVRFIDPKFGGDYPWLRRMPHVDGGIVDNQQEAMEVLDGLVEEMERRYREIMKVGSNIDRYNAKVEPDARLPRLFLFHDEIGDWMADAAGGDYRDAVAGHVVRLASKARAAGIHLVLITQRPDREALPPQIKANIGNKICLKVASNANSRIVLDEGGAERLLGSGHFAAKLANEVPSGQSSLIFGQAPFLDEDEAEEMADAIIGHWGR